MPAVSKKQQRYFGYLLSNPEERKKKGISKKAAKDFAQSVDEAIERQAKDRKKLSQPHSVSGSRRDHSHDVDSALTDHVPRKGKGRVRPASKKEMRVAAMREDKAFNYVLDKLRKKHGKDAVITKDSPKPKPASAAQKAKVAAERKKRQEADNKAFADRAKKAGYKNPQDYKVFNWGNKPTPFEKRKKY